jgi:hypothetical protein
MAKVVLGVGPTDHEIESGKLYLEFYGGRINNIMEATGTVENNRYVDEHPALPAITAFMKEEGWELSGSGFFSAVFVRGGLALKVGLKKEDSGATYAAWARANQGKAGVPVIYAIDKFTRCYVVLLDRCHPFDRGTAGTQLRCEATMVRDIIEHGDSPVIEMPITVTAHEIRTFFDGIAFFDVNSGNIMVDRFGRLVITDPVSYDHGMRSNHSRQDRPEHEYTYTYTY